CLSDLLCCLPQVSAPELGYENVFRVLIVQFMDARNLDIRALKKSCVHMVQPDGRLIPFESHNLFYRDGQENVLRQIRAELDQQRQWRLTPPPSPATDNETQGFVAPVAPSRDTMLKPDQHSTTTPAAR
ncbi:MAG: hypothetical protein ACRCTU_17640, partial [Zoogloea sp.]